MELSIYETSVPGAVHFAFMINEAPTFGIFGIPDEGNPPCSFYTILVELFLYVRRGAESVEKYILYYANLGHCVVVQLLLVQ